MAIDTQTWFSKGASGFGGSTVGTFDKFEQSANPKYHVGYQVEQADGSIYRYVHFGATVNRGVLVACDVSEMSVADTDNVVIAPASAVAVAGESVKPGALGSRYVELTLASIGVNRFQGAKLITTDDAGEGHTYDIIGNTATDDPATGNIRIELLQPLQVALDTTTDISIVANKYHNLEIATAGTDAIVVGVSCATILAADNYGWIQTRGVCGVLQDATVAAIGEMVQLSANTNGAVTVLGGTVAGSSLTAFRRTCLVGRMVDPGDSTGHSGVDLWLDA